MNSNRRRVVGLVVVAALVVGAIGVVASIPALEWRWDVIALKLSGEVPEIPIIQLLGWMGPRSPVWLGALPEQRNVSASIRNVSIDDAATVKAGAETFQRICSACHGGDAKGGVGPSLIAAVSNSTDWNFLSSAKWGRPGTAMAAQPLTDAQIWQVHSFLRQKARTWALESAGQSTRHPIDVSPETLLGAPEHPAEWLMYAGDYEGHRYSRLMQINKDTIRDLKVAWTAQLRPATRPLSSIPIVTGGLVFVTEAPDGVVALDAHNGSVVWRFHRPLDPSKLSLCCAAFNRGVAVLGKRVFVETLDAALVALDAETGVRLWETKVGEPKDGYSMTSAPLALDGAIVVGVAGGEFGMRGFVAAYSPDNGKQLWKLDTLPSPGQKGIETWAGDSWKTGGSPTWGTGSYDRERDVIYWSTGNPWPDLDDRNRKGDNLYTNSMLAIERKTGKMLWYFQYTPADIHDWDATQQPILTDIHWNGQTIPAVMLANRNAFYYALDRRDGKFLFAKPFVKQTWNKGFTAAGRPIVDPSATPTHEGTMVWPWMHGGTNWWPPSFDPVRRLQFVPTVDAATVYFAVDMKAEGGKMTMGGTTRLATNQPSIMAIKALDPDTGEVRWTTRLDRDDFHQFSRISGVVSTAGGIVFGGFEDRFVAMDSDTGKELWRFRPGGMTNAAPVTYSVDGIQYITALAGNVLYAFALPQAH